VTAINDLKSNFLGELLLPESAGYDQARRVWNGNIDKYPAIIARCTGVADVLTALRYARWHDLLIAVRGGGHNIAGLSTCHGGIVIDLGPMKGVRVDPFGRTATAGPGVIWREFDRETQQFGLVTPGGTVSHTGIAGLTLGGGLGWLSRRFGLTSDNLISADLITADGDLLHVSDEEQPELMWGLRGGGGNFGIVTSFTYRLHKLPGPILAGPMIYSGHRADELLHFARDWAAAAPEAMGVTIMLGTAPSAPFIPLELQGSPMVMIRPAWSGSIADGERELASLHAFRSPIVDLVAPIPYPVLQQAFDSMAVSGRPVYAKAEFLSAWDDAAIGTALKYQERITSPFSAIGFTPMGGALGRIDPGATAFAHRQASWACDILSAWLSPTEDPTRHIAWAHGLRQELGRVSTGSYVNHLHPDELDARRGYDDETHARLVTLKTAYDPHNVFRLNPNIRP
jgi:FAD/FMN-containing dehydrogenase